MGHSSSQENLLLHGLLSMDHSSFRKYPPTLAWGPIWAQQCGYLLWCCPLHGLQANTYSTMAISTGCKGFFAPVPGASPPSPSSLTLVFTGLFLTLFSPHSSPPYSVLLFLKYVLSEVPPAWLMGSAVSCGGSVVELAVSSMRQSLATFCRDPPAVPHY